MPKSRNDLTVGASRSLIYGSLEWPIHGLRHPPEGRASGWFVWTGAFSEADDFFLPWHTSHVVERIPQLATLLDLPPGYRFLIAPDYLDTWEDQALFDV